MTNSRHRPALALLVILLFLAAILAMAILIHRDLQILDVDLQNIYDMQGQP